MSAQRSTSGKIILHGTFVFVVVYTKNMVHTYEGLIGPLMQRLEHRLSDNGRHLTQLSEENKQLKDELRKSKHHSPVKFTAV